MHSLQQPTNQVPIRQIHAFEQEGQRLGRRLGEIDSTWQELFSIFHLSFKVACDRIYKILFLSSSAHALVFQPRFQIIHFIFR